VELYFISVADKCLSYLALCLQISIMSRFHFEFPDVKLLKKIWLNFVGQEGMIIETIVDTAVGMLK